MADKKVFNVHNLYPKDYSFNSAAFYADPEGYEFTSDDIAYWNAKELEEYEQTVPMTRYEKKLLRNWVMSGHSPYENAGSKYLCLTGNESYDFLSIYRIDKEISRNTRGMNNEEKQAYLREYMGCTDEEPEHASVDFWGPTEEEIRHPNQ